MAAIARGNVVVRGGGILSQRRPIFTHDSKCILVCSGEKVKIISCASGECVRELIGHRARVTGVQISPWNKLQALTSSEDGTVLLWDYMDNVILKQMNFDRPLYGLLVHEAHKNAMFLICHKLDAAGNTNHKKPLMVSEAHIPPAGSSQGSTVPMEILTPISARGERCLAFGTRGEFLACVIWNQLRIYSMADRTINKIHMDGPPPNCVACHPHEYCVAVGDENGRISLFWNIQEKASPVRTVDHWHALPLGDLCFSPEGTYLFSGGHECVLVRWQYNSKHRDFLPRLGASITHVACSPDGLMRALALNNNSILLVTTRVQHTVQGLNHSSFHQQGRSGPVPTGLSVDPRSKALVLNGRVGHLQFYHLSDDKLLFNLDITSENYISPEQLDKPLAHTEVTHVTFDHRGDWMITAERRDDGETSVELRLKFWQYEHAKQCFRLNTTVESPHQGAINNLCFRPPSGQGTKDDVPMATTTSKDGKFKTWSLVDDTDVDGNKVCWNCDSVGFYKNTEPSAAAFASDGSLLAVGFHEVLTLWDPDDNQLRKILCHATVNSQIRHLCFGHGSSSHLLVCSTSSSLTVWNLLTCRVSWSVSMDVRLLIADPNTQHFAIFNADNDLFVFQGSEPRPVFRLPSASESEVLSAIFVPSRKEASPPDALPWQHCSELFFLTRSQELLTVMSKEQAEREGNVSRYDMTTLHKSLPLTPFALLLEGARKRGTVDGGSSTRQKLASKNASTIEILAAPPHVLPPARQLCSSFIHSLLGPSTDPHRTQSSETDSEAESGDEREQGRAPSDDSDMETDAPAMSGASNNPGRSQPAEASQEEEVPSREAAPELSQKELRRLRKNGSLSLKWLSSAVEELALS
ncbi:WD repeat-containing protein 75-like [Diadema setosum]|uniref:WD repeat-containing protein 75-like n=1 Tax=Diadema setosum TaxID=31175 RepID=UPI003B3A4052